jgi:transposase InsO family protein
MGAGPRQRAVRLYRGQMPSPPLSTAAPARRSAGRPQPRLWISSYTPASKPVLRQPLEPGEYTARVFRAACERLGISQSMGRPGSALDNAVIEAWHSTLELELRSREHFATRTQARARVAAWIDDYNQRRRHSALRMMSPVDYEQALQAGEAA